MLSDEQLLRYNRQILLHDFDIQGQEKLQRAGVLIVGLGGLGCPAALYLAAAGVGRLVLADGDDVELSNLQRQLAHAQADIGVNKAQSAAATISDINPSVETQVIAHRLTGDALAAAVNDVDLVVDCSDNYPTRFELNRACITARVPLVSAAAVRSEGQLTVFDPASGGPCYRCLYPTEGADTALSCSESGVLAPVVGVFGALQAMEALKLLAGYGEPLLGQLLLMDLRSGHQQQLKLPVRPDCPDCSSLR
ncbi:molybdopterin-synthase adenylyltransferase MoeB [Halioglobus maricola]|uniref:Molybdopterin-synthase adenylyltransferase n=1 Tax=Halioglobus maricola TaxID=2601894 RepID=A0A5P9NH01_9GAMM|nr:molybdopterin-synthase adenylyltransferase MoeB [Halioglobus maricola]